MATELEKQMAELMAGVESTQQGAKDVEKSAARIRRKSKDIADFAENTIEKHSFSGLLEQVENEEAAQDLFKKLDSDANGYLDVKELQEAFKTLVKMEMSDEEVMKLIATVKSEDAEFKDRVYMTEFQSLYRAQSKNKK